MQQDADGSKRVSNAPYELRARLIVHRYGPVFQQLADLMQQRAGER